MSVASDDSRSEAERHFSLDMLQARVDEHASNLEESTRRRMQSLRELIDSREQELMEEIRDNAREQSQLLVESSSPEAMNEVVAEEYGNLLRLKYVAMDL